MNYIQQIQELLNSKIDVEPSLFDLYTLLVLVKGSNTTLEDVHDAWAIWRNNTNPAHKSLIPFEELTKEIQELDREYMLAIHSVAKVIHTP